MQLLQEMSGILPTKESEKSYQVLGTNYLNLAKLHEKKAWRTYGSFQNRIEAENFAIAKQAIYEIVCVAEEGVFEKESFCPLSVYCDLSYVLRTYLQKCIDYLDISTMWEHPTIVDWREVAWEQIPDWFTKSLTNWQCEELQTHLEEIGKKWKEGDVVQAVRKHIDRRSNDVLVCDNGVVLYKCMPMRDLLLSLKEFSREDLVVLEKDAHMIANLGGYIYLFENPKEEELGKWKVLHPECSVRKKEVKHS
jgi:hypothetical protein